MNIEKYVVSQSLAEKMDKLGWKKTMTIFSWVKLRGHSSFILCIRRGTTFCEVKKDCYHFMCNVFEWYSAPLFAEIWEELPWCINIGDDIYDLMIIKSSNREKETIIVYEKSYDVHKRLRHSDTPIYSNNPAEATGELWCWLVENKYLEV